MAIHLYYTVRATIGKKSNPKCCLFPENKQLQNSVRGLVQRLYCDKNFSEDKEDELDKLTTAFDVLIDEVGAFVAGQL